MFKFTKNTLISLALSVLACIVYMGCSEDECATCPTEEIVKGSTITTESLHPRPNAASYYDLWVAGPNDVFVCGATGIVYRWQGSVWLEYDTGTRYGLNGIWGASANDVFAVGEAGTILHFDGAGWNPMESNILHSLQGVWGAAWNDVYAIGYYGNILHYDGSQWANVDHGLITGPGTWYLYDIWGTAADDIYVVGYNSSEGLIWHYDGSSWSETRLGSRFYAVGGTAANNVFAGGSSGQMYRFNGSTWNSYSGMFSTDFRSIWGSVSNDVWAVGDKYDYGISRYIGAIWHFDNVSWSDESDATFDNEIRAVGGYASNEAYFAGAGNQLARFNGSGWSFINDSRITGNSLAGIWGFSSSTIWAVGGYGTIVNFDGSDWSSAASPTDLYLSAVWGSDPNNVYAVGESGTILHYDGSSWSEIPHGLTTESLNSIWGTWANDIRVGGANGTILYYNGIIWEDQSIDAISRGWINDLWASSTDNYFAVVDGKALRYDGTSWSILPLDGYYVGDVHGASADQVYFTASANLFGAQSGPFTAASPAQPPTASAVFRFDGSKLVEVDVGMDVSIWLQDIWVFGANNIFFLGGPGAVIAHYNGSTSTVETPKLQSWLSNFWGTGGNTVYATGDMGTIIRAIAN